MENIKAILNEANTTMDSIVECNVLLADFNEYADFNTVYSIYFNEAPPARAAFEVVTLPKNARVEVKCSAIC
jgi:2-iminobutanoate/2-iminopropanoate deaminase